MFTAFIGLQGSGIIVQNPVMLVSLASLRTNISGLLSLVELLLMIILEVKKLRSGILIEIIAVTLAGIPLSITKMPEAIVSQYHFPSRPYS